MDSAVRAGTAIGLALLGLLSSALLFWVLIVLLPANGALILFQAAAVLVIPVAIWFRRRNLRALAVGMVLGLVLHVGLGVLYAASWSRYPGWN